MLSLSDEELAIVSDFAKVLAPADRSKFLAAVAIELERYLEIGPGSVYRASAAAQKQFFRGPTVTGRPRGIGKHAC